MNRRDFLKLGGATSLALLLQATPLAKALGFSHQRAAAAGILFRGTTDGKIYTSADNGKTWDLMVNFGSAYSIRRIARDSSGQVIATLRYARRAFELALSENGKSWQTV